MIFYERANFKLGVLVSQFESIVSDPWPVNSITVSQVIPATFLNSAINQYSPVTFDFKFELSVRFRRQLF